MPTPPQAANMSPSQMVLQQQHLQRAFLQSAVAQNIQIQQHLMAQNQALQQLLSQSIPVGGHSCHPFLYTLFHSLYNRLTFIGQIEGLMDFFENILCPFCGIDKILGFTALFIF